MSEADTPNNGNFLQPLNSTSCPFDFVWHHANKTISQLPLLAPAEDEQSQADAPLELDSVTQPNFDPPSPADKTDEQNQVFNQQSPPSSQQEQFHPSKAELDEIIPQLEPEKQTPVESEFQQLLSLNQQLRSDNDDLYAQVRQLQTALAESEEALQLQLKRSTITQTMLEQQARELAASQEQIQSLFQQLETALSTVQSQEILIENYKAQLEISQQRLAQLERECALLQTKYNEQSQQLLQSENSCRELRARLMRQQRQTLQFKAALEKCLETTVPSYDFLQEAANQNNFTTSRPSYSQQASSIFSHPRPIRPWSAEADANKVQTPPHQSENFSLLSSPLSSEIPISKNPPSTDEPAVSNFDTDDDSCRQPTTTSPSESLSLEEKLNHLFQTFYISQPEKNFENGNEACSQVAEATEQSQTTTPPYSLQANSQAEQNPHTDPLPAMPETFLSPQSSCSNSPSPLLYPQRPPKERKSRASVELPNFCVNNHNKISAN